MKTKLLLIRHGESTANAGHYFAGQTDAPLSQLGRKQAETTGEYLKTTHIDAFYSSDLSRAYETGLAVARYHEKPVIPTTHLREIFCGAWEGLPREQIIAQYPETYDIWRNATGLIQMPDGENAGQVQVRMWSYLNAVVNTHMGQTVCIASHAFAIRVFTLQVLGLPLERMMEHPFPSNASVTTVIWEDGKFTLEEYSHDTHLADMATYWVDKA